MSLVTHEDVTRAEEAFMKLRAEYDALSRPIDPHQLRIALEGFATEICECVKRIDRIEKILWEISAACCQHHGLQIIPF